MVLAAPTHPPLLHTPTHSVVFTPVQWKHITPRGPAWQGQRKWPGINGCFDYSLVTNVANMKDKKRRGGWLHPQWEAIWWHLRVSGPALMLPFGSHSNVGRYTNCTKCSGLDKSEVIGFFFLLERAAARHMSWLFFGLSDQQQYSTYRTVQKAWSSTKVK